MERETAQIILYSIAGIGFLVWLAALQFILNSYRSRKRNVELAQPIEWAELPPEHVLVGSIEADGKPAELAAKMTSLLARPGNGPLGLVRITEREPDRVSFEWAACYGPNPSSSKFRRGQIRFSPESGQRSRIDYAIELPGGKGLMLAAVLIQLLGLVALLVGFWAIQTYVVNSENPGIRGQAVQMVQCVHFLWPPFLFAGLYRMWGRTIRTSIETMVHNLPHVT